MTVEQAKEMFFKARGTLFGVWDTYGTEAYEEYRKVVTEELREEWADEMIASFIDRIKKNDEKNVDIYNALDLFMENFRNSKNLKIMKNLLPYIHVDTNDDKLFAAVIIIGKRGLGIDSGMIYWSNKLGNKECATFFARKALDLLASIDETEDQELILSVQEETEKCQKIIEELGLHL